MTYELAKQLKEAGFIQQGFRGNRETDSFYLAEKYIVTRKTAMGITSGTKESLGMMINFSTELIYIPTLFELIEACGESIMGIYFKHDGEHKVNAWTRAWLDNEPEQYDKDVECFGDTAEEAFANLWLRLKINNKL